MESDYTIFEFLLMLAGRISRPAVVASAFGIAGVLILAGLGFTYKRELLVYLKKNLKRNEEEVAPPESPAAEISGAGRASASSAAAPAAAAADGPEDMVYDAEFFADLPKECGFDIVTVSNSVLHCEAIRKITDEYGVFALPGNDRSVRLRYENIKKVTTGLDDV